MLVDCNNNIRKEISQIEEKNIVIRNNSQIFLDTISINQVIIDDIPFEIKYDELITMKKYSMVFSEWVCGSPFNWTSDSIDNHDYFNYYSYYTMNLEYITNKYDAILYSWEIKNHITKINNKNIILNELISLNDFKTIFPKSYEHYLKTKKRYPLNYEDGDYIYVGFSSDKPEDHWICYF